MFWLRKIIERWDAILSRPFYSKEEPNWEVWLTNRLGDIYNPIWRMSERVRPRLIKLFCQTVLMVIGIVFYMVALTLFVLIINAAIVSPVGGLLVVLGWIFFGMQGITWGLVGMEGLIVISFLWHNRPHHEPRTSDLF